MFKKFMFSNNNLFWLVCPNKCISWYLICFVIRPWNGPFKMKMEWRRHMYLKFISKRIPENFKKNQFYTAICWSTNKLRSCVPPHPAVLHVLKWNSPESGGLLASAPSVATSVPSSIFPALSLSSISHPPLIPSPVWPYVCGGPPGEEVSLPATAPGAGFTGRPEWDSKEDGLQSHMLGSNNLQLQRHPQQLELRRGDPASCRHPS